MGYDSHADAGRELDELARYVRKDIQVSGLVEGRMDGQSDDLRHLKPGFGFMEHVEIDMEPRCDDGTLPANSSITTWTRLLLEATAHAYRPLAYNTETRSMLERAGFVDIEEQVIRIPLNPWPKDPFEKDIGRWYNLGLTQGLQALTLAPLTRMLNWTPEEVERLLVDVKREVCNKKYHVYCNL